MSQHQNEELLQIRLPPRIITQLGGALYGSFVPAICETISNSYDADATLVTITIDKNEVCIEDNGIGMSWETLQDSFLMGGNNRRTEENQGKTKKGRLVTGKKGLGKFALFGLCKKIHIETSDGNYVNAFSVDIDDLNSSNEDAYFLKPSPYNKPSIDKKSYTRIVLKELFKKPPSTFMKSLARRINYVFKDKNDEFLIEINWSNNKREKLDQATRQSLIRDGNNQRIIYDIPESLSTKDEDNKIKLDQSSIDYMMSKNIRGFLIAREGTVRDPEQKGLAIFSRGKICQDPSYFDIQQANAYGYAHLYGELEIDFIDADIKDDYISTNRKEIKWEENQELDKLRKIINILLHRYALAYKKDKKRMDKKQREVEMKKHGIEPEWVNEFKGLNSLEKQMLEVTIEALYEKHPVGIEKFIDFYKKVLLNYEYIHKILESNPRIRKFYNDALGALKRSDFETVIIKANAMLEEVTRQVPDIQEAFRVLFEFYKGKFSKQEARDHIKSLLNPLRSFSTENNPIEALRSSTQTAHNTEKNMQPLDDSHLAQLVLNYTFTYVGFVLNNPGLFSQSSDSSKEGQHSQSDEQ